MQKQRSFNQNNDDINPLTKFKFSFDCDKKRKSYLPCKRQIAPEITTSVEWQRK